MKTVYIALSIIYVATLVLACSTPYYGYTKEQWEQLSTQEKEALKKEYQAVIDARNNQKNTDKIDDREQSIIDYGVTHPRTR